MRIRTIGTAAILALIGMVSPARSAAPQGQAPPPAATGPGFTLMSPAFEDGSIIPGKFTQSVSNYVSPKLQWSNVPPNTVSFVLTVRDPDGAPQKRLDDVLHWLIFNIPGTARELPEGVPPTPKLPDGSIQIKNTRGDVGYRGPGAGAAGPYHHYTFEIYALDEKLDLGPDASRADVMKAIDGHILGKAVMMGRFHR